MKGRSLENCMIMNSEITIQLKRMVAADTIFDFYNILINKMHDSH
jgi:hypothetical protein